MGKGWGRGLSYFNYIFFFSNLPDFLKQFPFQIIEGVPMRSLSNFNAKQIVKGDPGKNLIDLMIKDTDRMNEDELRDNGSSFTMVVCP